MSASSWAEGLQDLSLGMGVWGIVRGLTAVWELKASKVSSSVIVTVWLAQIGHAVVSAWLPCSSLRHGTEQHSTSTPMHQTRSGTHPVLSSRQFTHADTWSTLWLFGKRAWLLTWCNSTRQTQYLNVCSDWKCQVCSLLFRWAKTRVWINQACKVKPENQNKTVAVLNYYMLH